MRYPRRASAVSRASEQHPGGHESHHPPRRRVAPDEVRDVATENDLAPKGDAEPGATEVLPEQGLGGGGRVAHAVGAFGEELSALLGLTSGVGRGA